MGGVAGSRGLADRFWITGAQAGMPADPAAVARRAHAGLGALGDQRPRRRDHYQQGVFPGRRRSRGSAGVDTDFATSLRDTRIGAR